MWNRLLYYKNCNIIGAYSLTELKCDLMKNSLFLHVFAGLLLSLPMAKSGLAQTANFSQMPGLQSMTTTQTPKNQQNMYQMSAEDMSFGTDNQVSFSADDKTPVSASQSQNFSLQGQKNAARPQAETLTDALQQQGQATSSGLNISGTWVDKAAQSVSQAIESQSAADNNTEASGDSSDGSLQSLMNISRENRRRSNASVFDISGVMLRMNLSQVEKAMLSRGFKPVSQKMEIPNFIKWRNEEKCRNNGVVGYERLMNCVVQMAKKNNYQYVETAKFAKYDTKEEMEIKFTSNFTGNKVYRIMYQSMSGKVIGSGAKAAYLRNIKVYDFWKKINQKYGAPDNKDEVTWGLGGNKPYMKAATGFLVLEDPMLRELDYTRMSREDQRFMNTDLYSF